MQSEKRQIQCPLCDSTVIQKMPSAPRLNLPRDAPAENDGGATVQARLLALARHMVEHTEDVGDRFAEEARRIYYNEVPQRGIRGLASNEECRELAEEGIDVLQLPLPPVRKQTLQ